MLLTESQTGFSPRRHSLNHNKNSLQLSRSGNGRHGLLATRGLGSFLRAAVGVRFADVTRCRGRSSSNAFLQVFEHIVFVNAVVAREPGQGKGNNVRGV